MKRYESRFCTFSVPDAWEIQAPFGFVEPGDLEELHAAQALEQWQEEAMTAEEALAHDKDTLPHLMEGFEMLADGPTRLNDSAGQAAFLSYRHLNEDQEPVLVRRTYLTHGPLMVQLEVSRPEEEDTSKKAELTEKISQTLSLRNVEFMDRHRPLVLFSVPDDENPQAAQRPELSEQRRELTRCCVSVPLLEGWSFAEDDETGSGVYSRGPCSIRLQRPVGEENDAEEWFKLRIEDLQVGGALLLGSGQGEGPDDVPYATVLYQERGDQRTWNRQTAPRRFQIFLEDRQPLIWSLEVPESELESVHPLFEALIQQTVFLPTEQWRTQLAESWIDCVLSGPWTSEGPGIYFELDRKIIIQAGSDSNRVPLKNIHESIIESIKGNLKEEEPFEEEQLAGRWQGADSLHYAVDGKNALGEPTSFRTLWCSRDNTLYSTVVLGQDPQSAQQEFEPLARGIRLDPPNRPGASR